MGFRSVRVMAVYVKVGSVSRSGGDGGWMAV